MPSWSGAVREQLDKRLQVCSLQIAQRRRGVMKYFNDEEHEILEIHMSQVRIRCFVSFGQVLGGQ